jgi:hypothetical protein
MSRADRPQFPFVQVVAVHRSLHPAEHGPERFRLSLLDGARPGEVLCG